MRIFIRLLINAAALWVAAYFLDPDMILRTDDVVGFLIVVVVFGLVNAFIKPIVKLLSLPVRILTLGLFALVINTAMLAITAALTEALDIPGGFVTAFIGALIVSVVSAVLGWVVPDED